MLHHSIKLTGNRNLKKRVDTEEEADYLLLMPSLFVSVCVCVLRLMPVYNDCHSEFHLIVLFIVVDSVVPKAFHKDDTGCTKEELNVFGNTV